MVNRKPREARKTRAWEQERRKRLSEAFSELCKLLPSYDPGIKLSQIEIIQQAGSCIKDLQEKVKKLLTSPSEGSTAESVESVKKIEGLEIRKLYRRVRKLLSKNEQLCRLLTDAKITIPREYIVLKSKPSKWTNKFTPEQAEILQKKQHGKENDADLDKTKCDPPKASSGANATPKHRKVIHRRSSDQKKSKPTKRKKSSPSKKLPSKCVIVLSQPTNNTQSCYVITNAPSTNHIINGASSVITNSSFLTATPLVSSNVKSYKPTNVPQPVPTLSTTNTLLFAANGTILPIIPQPTTTLPVLPLASQIIGGAGSRGKPLMSNAPPPPKVIILPGTSTIKTTPKTTSNIVQSNITTTAPPVILKGQVCAPAAADVKVSPRFIRPKYNNCLTRTTQVNKVPIPALTSRYSTNDLVLRDRKDNVSSKTGVDKTKAGGDKKKSVQNDGDESQKKEEPVVVVAKRKLNADDKKVENTKKTRTEVEVVSGSACEDNNSESSSDKNSSATAAVVVADDCGTSSLSKEPSEPRKSPAESTSTPPESSERVGTSLEEPNESHVETEAGLSEKVIGIRETVVEHSTELVPIKPVNRNQEDAISTEQVAQIQEVVVEQSAEQQSKPLTTKNHERDVDNKAEEVRQAGNTSALCQEITEQQSKENPAAVVTGKQEQLAGNEHVSEETVQQQKTGQSSTNSENTEEVQESQRTSQNSTRDHLKALELNLDNHSELSNDIFASLQVPGGCQNPESTSPTAAFLLAFPLVSSLTGGVKVTEVTEEDNTPGSQRETPTLLQIGTMDSTKPTQSHADSLTPSFLNLDSLSFFSSQNNNNNNNNNHNEGGSFFTTSDSTTSTVAAPTTTAPGTATTSSVTCSRTAEQIKPPDGVTNSEQPQQGNDDAKMSLKTDFSRLNSDEQLEEQNNDSAAKVSLGTDLNRADSDPVKQTSRQLTARQPEQQNQAVHFKNKEQGQLQAEQQSQMLVEVRSYPLPQMKLLPNQELSQKQLHQHSDNNNEQRQPVVQQQQQQQQQQEQHCQMSNVTTNLVQDCSVLQHFQNNEARTTNLPRLDPLVNYHLMKLPPNKADSAKNPETNRRHPHQQPQLQQQQQQQVFSGYNNNKATQNKSSSAVVVSSSSGATNNYQYNNTFPDLSKIAPASQYPSNSISTISSSSNANNSFIKSYPDPLYTQCNNNAAATYNYGYHPATAQNTFNQNYYKTMATKDSRSYYSLNYENYSDYNSRKNDVNSHFSDNYYNSSNNNHNNNNNNNNNSSNNHYSTNNNKDSSSSIVPGKFSSSSNNSGVVSSNNKPGTSNNNKVQANRPPINWMTTPDNKTQSADYVLPQFTKDSTSGDFIGHNAAAISHSNSVASNMQTSYFNTTNPIYSNNFDTNQSQNHQQHQTGDLSSNKKACFDLPLVPPPSMVNSYNQQKNNSDASAVAEENQFSWSPTKIPQFFDHSHGFVSSTLPTLVGDLALSLMDQPSNKFHNSNNINNKKDNTAHQRRPKNYDNNNSGGGGSNFLSVSQLVDHGKSEPQRTTTRRNSANNRSSKKVHHQHQHSKQQNSVNQSPRHKMSETNKDTIPMSYASSSNNKTTVDGKMKPNYNMSNNVQQQQTNSFCDQSKNRSSTKNPSISSSYSAEALIGHQIQDNHQQHNNNNNSRHHRSTAYPSSSSAAAAAAASIRALPPASFLAENMLPYFPPVELQQQQQQQQPDNTTSASAGYNIQPNQNYHLNPGHNNYGSGSNNGFQNNSYTSNSFVGAPVSSACGVAPSISASYLSSNNFMHDSTGHDYNADNLNLFPPSSSKDNNKVCTKASGSTASNKIPNQHHHHQQQQQQQQLSHLNNSSAKKPPKTPNKRLHLNDTSNLPAGIVDFSFLSIPCSISSPILPDDFHSGFLQPPPTAPQLYPCQNPLYPASCSTASTTVIPSTKQNDLTSNSLYPCKNPLYSASSTTCSSTAPSSNKHNDLASNSLLIPPSLPQPPLALQGVTTTTTSSRSGTANVIQHPEISPTINSGSTAATGSGGGGGGTSSLTNFNLSTIFPEINKPCALAEPYLEPRIKDHHPPKSFTSSTSQVTFNDKPTFSFSYINNCPTSQPFNNQ